MLIEMCELLWPVKLRLHPFTYFTDFLCFSFFPPALLQCELGELVCEGLPGCVPLQKRCDLNADCLPFLSDESSCHGNMFLLTFNILSFLVLLCSLYDSLILKTWDKGHIQFA